MSECVNYQLIIAMSALTTLTTSVGCHLILDIEETTLLSVCGDGVLDENSGEKCDDGNEDTNDDCPDGPGGSCQFSTCGDGFVHALEEMCDDGNGNVNDGCPDGPGAFCENAFCGDGFLFTGTEECDFGAFDSCPEPQVCNASCRCV